MNTCQGITLQNRQCCRYIRRGMYCYQHSIAQPRFMQEKPSECIVCCESLANQHNALACGHWIHTKCIINSAKAECPICRHQLLFNKTITNRINKLAKKRADEMLIEEEEYIHNSLQYQISEHIHDVVDQILDDEILMEDYYRDILLNILGAEDMLEYSSDDEYD